MNGPIVLVVEDDPDALDLRVRQLNGVGCRAIAVSNPNDAIRELWHAPLLGGVLTDINLLRAGEDKSGIALARYIRRNRPSLPISGYSGVFAEDRLSAEERSLFNSYYSAGRLNPNQIREAINEFSDLARTFEAARREEAEQKLERLRSDNGVSRDDFETYRRLIPDRDLATEQALAGAQLHAEIVGPDHVVDMSAVSQAEPTKVQLRIPVVIWLRDLEGQNADGVEAEMHGVPELYAHGSSEKEAIDNVMRLAVSYFRDLEEADDLVEPLSRLRDFLLGVFKGSEKV